MQRIYIRFSKDIRADIKRGYSYDFSTRQKLNGLCAWSTPFDIIGDTIVGTNNISSEDDIIDHAKNILKNTYGSYSDNSTVHIITGTYVGAGNDGVILKDIELIKTLKL